MTDRELVDALEEVWSSMRAVGTELVEGEWSAPTDCPGWTVQDVFAHIVGIEEVSMGHDAPHVDVPDYDHVTSDIGRMNEVWVESMRSMTGSDVLDRFTIVTEARLAELCTLDEAGFGADSWTPAGPGTVRDLIPFRIFDSWVHEQDIRRAVDRPGGLDGTGAAVTLERCVGSMGYVVGKSARAPDGTTVRFDLLEPLARSFSVGVEGGRGSLLDEDPDDPTVTVVTSGDTFVRLACGRATATDAEITATGDAELGAAILANLRFLKF